MIPIFAEASQGVLAPLWEFVQDYPDPVVLGLLVLCGVGLPVPEEPILLMAGAVAVELSSGGQSGFQVQLVRMTLDCAVGILIGDMLCFHLGRKLGRGILRVRFVKLIATKGRRVRAERFFARYGPWSIFIARFFAGVRLVMFFGAGMSRRVSYLRFLLMDFLGVMVTVPLSIYIGFKVYHELSDWQKARAKLGPFHLMLMIAMAVGVVVWFILAKKKRVADREENRTRVVKD
jgi:membrane protein DedA with SNARE-associated domain